MSKHEHKHPHQDKPRSGNDKASEQGVKADPVEHAPPESERQENLMPRGVQGVENATDSPLPYDPDERPHRDPAEIPQPPLEMGSSIEEPVTPPLRREPDPAKPIPSESEALSPDRGPIGATGFARNPEKEGSLIHPVKEVPDIQYSSAETTKDNPHPTPPSGNFEPVDPDA